MTCCVILHNMIVKEEGDGAAQTHEYEKLGVQVHIPKQDAGHILGFSGDASESSKSKGVRATTEWFGGEYVEPQ